MLRCGGALKAQRPCKLSTAHAGQIRILACTGPETEHANAHTNGGWRTSMFRKLLRASILGSTIAAAYVGGAHATPGSGFTSADISAGRFDEIGVTTTNAPPHEVRLDTKAASD